jgi:hypothetical protein
MLDCQIGRTNGTGLVVIARFVAHNPNQREGWILQLSLPCLQHPHQVWSGPKGTNRIHTFTRTVGIKSPICLDLVLLMKPLLLDVWEMYSPSIS